MRRKVGFTLVELIIAIIVISICFLSVALMYQEVLRGAFQTRILSTATALAEEKMEEVLSKGYLEYSGVTKIGPTSFTRPGFTEYSFQVNFYNVGLGDPPDDALDTPVLTETTQYKKVEVKVMHSGIADITLTSLIANYTN
jgi:prepilin-type N-terminal cleavage/methylation domain-containing protein